MKKVLKYFMYVCFSPTGRINRAWWWFYVLLSTSFYWGLTIWIIDNTGGYAPDFVFFCHVIMGGVMAYPSIVVSVKRFQDTNRSGWHVLWALLPFFGALYILIVCGFFNGTDGENKYGEPSYLVSDWDSYTQGTSEEKHK